MTRSKAESTTSPSQEAEQIPGLSELADAFTSLRTRGEVTRFLRDLCTLPELEALAHRWQTALLLDICNGALQVHNNAVNERLNQVMKYMAIVSTLMLPMTVISGTFGMNFDVIPISHHGYGFWMAVGLMLASAAALLAIFRARRWF